jgi:hypothetical protein
MFFSLHFFPHRRPGLFVSPDILFILASLVLHPGWPPCTRHIVHPRFTCPPSRTATMHQTYSSSLRSSSVQDGHHAPDILFILASLVLRPGRPPCTRHIIHYSSSLHSFSIQDSHHTPHPHPPSRHIILYTSSLHLSSIQDSRHAPDTLFFSTWPSWIM